MIRRVLPALIIVAVALAGGPARTQKAAQKCGFIAEVSGKAVLRRGPKYFLLSGMEGVYCGETIKVMAGSRVVIAVCATSTRTEIIGPAEFILGARQFTFKTGKAKSSTPVNADLCPFFLAQSFEQIARIPRPQVDANGDVIDGVTEMTGCASGMGPGSQFGGYLSEVKGDVYFTDEPVRKVLGDVAPAEERVLAAAGSELSINSCDEGKKYLVRGPALFLLRDEDSGKKVVAFLKGKPWKVEEIEDGKQCRDERKRISQSDSENLKWVGLDGKELPPPSSP